MCLLFCNTLLSLLRAMLSKARAKSVKVFSHSFAHNLLFATHLDVCQSDMVFWWSVGWIGCVMTEGGSKIFFFILFLKQFSLNLGKAEWPIQIILRIHVDLSAMLVQHWHVILTTNVKKVAISIKVLILIYCSKWHFTGDTSFKLELLCIECIVKPLPGVACPTLMLPPCPITLKSGQHLVKLCPQGN